MSRLLRILVPVVVIVLGMAGAAWAVDSAHRDTIATGVTIAGVQVGGLSSAAAGGKVAASFRERLGSPVTVKAGGRKFLISSKRAGVEVDVGGAVQQALSASRTGWLGARVWRDLAGQRVSAAITPGVVIDRRSVDAFSRRVAAKVDRPAVEPHLTFGPSSVSVAKGTPGIRVSASALADSIAAALVQPSRGAGVTVEAPMRTIQPQAGTANLADRYPTVITVDRSTRTLHLFKHLKPFKDLPVAVGMAGLETPPGLYSIQDKQVDPVWHVPKSAWAGSLAGKSIPPGPSNPIKARWMGLAAGVGIHGTADDGSIGSAASHGCVRMHVSDVIWLYDQVSVGTPVYIS